MCRVTVRLHTPQASTKHTPTSPFSAGSRSVAQANPTPSAPVEPSSPPRSWSKLPMWAVEAFERHQECTALGLDDLISYYVGHAELSFSLQQLHALLDDSQLLPYTASDVEALLLAHAHEGRTEFFTVSRRDFARLLARAAQRKSLAEKITPAQALWNLMSKVTRATLIIPHMMTVLTADCRT